MFGFGPGWGYVVRGGVSQPKEQEPQKEYGPMRLQPIPPKQPDIYDAIADSWKKFWRM